MPGQEKISGPVRTIRRIRTEPHRKEERMGEKEEKRVSVIIPVYNTEKQLERCIRSVREQTYTNLEILLVDDGSTDTSPMLCDRAAKKDGRIRVVHKKNGGVSSARNEGLAQAGGDYIVFVDSDDWIEKEMIALMVRFAGQYQAPLAVCGYLRAAEEKRKGDMQEDLPESGEKQEKKADTAKNKEMLISSEELLEYYLLEDEKIRIPHSVWGKLFAKELIGPKRFPIIKRTEELLFSTEIFCEAKQCVYLPHAFYHYCDDREESLMHCGDAEHTVEKEIPLLAEQIRLIEQNGFGKEAELAYFCFGKRLLYFYLGFRDRMLKKEARRVKEYAAEHRGRILRSLKGEGIKKTDKARLFLFVWAPGIYYRFVLWHDRRGKRITKGLDIG